MATTKTPPTSTRGTTRGEPVLERFYNVSQAAVRLGLREPEADGKKGEKWLRDGFNRPEDGSKGRKFPGRYMANQLMFSESELAVIAQIALDAATTRKKPRPSAARLRRRRMSTLAAA
jgi:hypothetical protein